MTNIPAMLNQGVRLHQEGRFDAAATIYRQVLSLDATNGDALHLLGLVSIQTGQNQAALELLRKAVAANNRDASFHFHLGYAEQALGELAEQLGGILDDPSAARERSLAFAKMFVRPNGLDRAASPVSRSKAGFTSR